MLMVAHNPLVQEELHGKVVQVTSRGEVFLNWFVLDQRREELRIYHGVFLKLIYALYERESVIFLKNVEISYYRHIEAKDSLVPKTAITPTTTE